MKRIPFYSAAVIIIALILIYCFLPEVKTKAITYEAPIQFNPPSYVCYQISHPITIDGKLNPEEWDNIPWSNDFTDIEGDKRPVPHLQTRVKMAYDSLGLYFAALMEEPHVWGNIIKHDAVIFHDNDFEIFLNPSGDTHNYMEYEVNALGTVWDLFLTKPYRDGAVVLNNWEFSGMRSAVYVDGTINNPNDTDRSWSVEVFIPWTSIYQPLHRSDPPLDGEQIRVNFSRVQWTTTVNNGNYKKTPIAGEDKIREYNWVWAPTGVIDIHRPEFWGFVQFSDKKAGTGEELFNFNPDENIKWALRNLYYRQAHYRKTVGNYASALADLQPEDICTKEQLKKITLHSLPSAYEITFEQDGEVWHIRQDGLVWKQITR